MEHKKIEFEIGGNALVATIATVATLSATALGFKFMDDRKKLEIIKADKPVKNKSDTTLEIDPKTWKVKLNRKNEFEVMETKTIIKEVPVVPGFKKMKKVRVKLDKNGMEIPGAEEDIVG
jgi:hypothetical protein